jgi:phosphoglycerate dehydrogenase-like enzyme
MFKILFTGNTFTAEDTKQLKNEGYEIISAEANLNEIELIKQLQNIDAYIVGGKEIVSENVIQASVKNLKLITNLGIGTGTIDVQAAKKYGIPVANTLKVSTYSVAEFAVGMLMTLNKRIFEFSSAIHNNEWQRLEMYDLKNRTVGIVGMGSIGTYTARILHNAFNMDVIYTDIVQKFSVEEEMNAKKVTLESLLSESDFVSLHAPLNDKTKNMIGERELSLMKKDALLINTARAWIVEPVALYNSLVNEAIAGAAFDGFYSEPVDSAQPGGNLLDLPSNKFLLTPHTGFNAYENVEKINRITIENLKSVLNGLPCPNVVS